MPNIPGKSGSIAIRRDPIQDNKKRKQSTIRRALKPNIFDPINTYLVTNTLEKQKPKTNIPSVKGSNVWQEQNAIAILNVVFPHLDKKLNAEPTIRAEWRRSSLFSLLSPLLTSPFPLP